MVSLLSDRCLYDTKSYPVRIVLLVGHGSYTLEMVLNFTGCLEKSLNSVKGRESTLFLYIRS